MVRETRKLAERPRSPRLTEGLRWATALALALPWHAIDAAGRTQRAGFKNESAAIAPALGDEDVMRSYDRVILDIGQRRSARMVQLALDERDALPARHSNLMKIALADTNGPIAVVYPDIGEPYRSVFTQILEGIDERVRGQVLSIAVGDSTSPQEVNAELRAHNIRVVIALGRHGLRATSALDKDTGLIASAILGVPENDAHPMAVHSLSPDPALLFARLKQLMPEARRVFVVYDPRQNAWLMKLARDAAQANGLDLVTTEVGDLRAAARAYRDILDQANPRSDAIWLPQDSSSVDDNTILPYLLQECWNRSLVLFSSTVSHAKRGALFALYPNNAELGRALAGSALGMLNGNGSKGVQPLRAVQMAVNTRTASHLGISFSARHVQVDLSFPSP